MATRFSSSSLVVIVVIRFAKQRDRSELTNSNVTSSVDEYSIIVTAQQLGDRIMQIMHIFSSIMHISRLKYNSWIENLFKW